MAKRKHDKHLERRIGIALIVMAVLLACWAIWLAVGGFPKHNLQHQHHHLVSVKQLSPNDWTATWVGLDIIEVAGLFTTGYLLHTGRKGVRTVALLSIPVFTLDAWFDIMTAVSSRATMRAILMAAFLEVPTALLLAWVARRIKR